MALTTSVALKDIIVLSLSGLPSLIHIKALSPSHILEDLYHNKHLLPFLTLISKALV